MKKVNLPQLFFPFIFRLDSNTRYNLKIDTFSSINFGIFAGAFYPFFVVTAVRLGAANTLLALIAAAPYLGQLFAIYWGHRSEQGAKLPYVVYASFISRALVVVLALTSKPEVFALFVMLHFLVAAAGGPAYTALVRKVYPLEFRGQIMGKMQFVIGLVRVGVTYLAGLWLDKHGYSSLFIIAGFFGMLASIIYSHLKEPQDVKLPAKKPFSLQNSLRLLKTDALLALTMLAFFVFDTGNLILSPIYPLVQVKVMGLTNLQIAQLSICWIIGWFATAPFWGKLVDARHPSLTIIVSIILFAGPPFIYFWQSPYYFLMLASFLGGAAGSSLEVGWLNLMMNLGGEKSSQYSGLYLTLLGLRGLLGPLLGNLLLKFLPIRYIFLITLIFLLLGLLLFIKILNTGHKIKMNQLAM